MKPIDFMPKPSTHAVKSASEKQVPLLPERPAVGEVILPTPKVEGPRPVSPEQISMFLQHRINLVKMQGQVEQATNYNNIQTPPMNPVLPTVLGGRPVVQEIYAKVRMSRITAEQMFKNIVFSEGETEVILTEVMVPAKPGQPIACVHGASGQKFVIDHYELDGDVL